MKPSYIPLAIVISLGITMPAAAQDSRGAHMAQQQAEKAAALPPYVPGKGEVLVKKIESFLYGTPKGFYPYLDSVYSGGGLTVGAGYRDFYGDSTFWDVKGLYSIKGYTMAEVSTTSLGLAGGRVALNARLGLRAATEVGFYGIGGDTGRDDRANYRFKQTWVGRRCDLSARRVGGLRRRVGVRGLQPRARQGPVSLDRRQLHGGDRTWPGPRPRLSARHRVGRD